MKKSKKLQPGDIVLSHGHYLLSRMIRNITHSYWNHASIFVGNNKVIEARGLGVVVSPFVDKGKDTLVLRVPLTAEQRRNIILYAESQIGKKYDYFQLLSLFFYFFFGLPAKDVENHFICSELVAMAYESAGVKLAEKNVHLITPANLAMSAVLKKVA